MQHARPYAVGALLLGTWPPGTTLTVTDNGAVTHADSPNPQTWTGAQLFHITSSEATGLLQVIRTANGVPEPGDASKPASATGSVSTSTESGTDPAEHTTPPSDGPAAALSNDHAVPKPANQVKHGPSGRGPADRPVQLRLLGAVEVQIAGTPIVTGLRRISYDLLAFLALNPDGIAREQAIDAIWADKTPETGAEMWHTAINNIRKTLRNATKLREPMFIIRTAGRYRLDPTMIDVDIWRLQDLIHTAQQTKSDAERLDLLKNVPDLYTGELAADLTHQWAETHREYLRRQGTNALAYLAHLTQYDNPDQALAALEEAIIHDPHAEALYRSIMRLQAHLHQPDAIRRTYQLLETRLAELDIDPTEETHQLFVTLLRKRS